MTRGHGTHTFESGVVYLDSLIRNSICYAGETYYNISENELRMLEQIEENCMKEILNTGQNVPLCILYLDLGRIPVRFHIQKMMLNFLQCILKEDKNTTLYKFFKAQCEQPTKGDWVSEVRKILIKSDVNMSFDEISKMKQQAFMKIVDNKLRKTSLIYLKSKVKSKGSEIKYGNELKCQSYLLPNHILTLSEQREIFAYRSRMNNLKYNFPGTNDQEQCKCQNQLTNEHLYQCTLLNNNEIPDLPYENIFNGTIQDQKKIIHILNKNIYKHEELTLAQDSPFEPLVIC